MKISSANTNTIIGHGFTDLIPHPLSMILLLAVYAMHKYLINDLTFWSTCGAGDICMGETEAGKFSGEVVIKVDTEAEKNTILNLNLSGISDNIAIKEIGAGAYFKIAKKTNKDSQGRNLFIRLKGMEWTAAEEDVRKFLADVSIVELIMTKTSTGRPTGNDDFSQFLKIFQHIHLMT